MSRHAHCPVSKHRQRAALAFGAVVLGSGTAATMASAADTAAAAVEPDFNGDGVTDLVVATPKAPVGGYIGAGSVTITYGSADGISPTRSATLTQNSSGIPGAAEQGDRFGASYATGDLDGDGYTDLVVGAPGEQLSNSQATGTVTVLWGGANGLTQGGAAISNPTSADPTSPQKQFGLQVAVGDFDGDGDGRAQLAAVGESQLWTFGDDFTRTTRPTPVLSDDQSGSVWFRTLTTGDFQGTGRDQLVATGPQDCDGYGCQYTAVYAANADGTVVRKNTLAGPNSGGDQDDPTKSAATGDLNHDGYTDLVTGHTPASSSAAGEYSDAAGYVFVRYGSADGLGAHRTARIDQNTSGVPGVNESGDNFGASVAVGDVTGDGYADVAVGAPGESVDYITQTGEVVLLKGSSTGLTGTGAQAFHQATSGVPGASEAYDWFGSAVRVADINGNGKADVAIAAKGEDVFSGSTRDGSDWVLRGSSAGLTTTNATAFSEKSFGFTYRNGEFGSTLGN